MSKKSVRQFSVTLKMLEEILIQLISGWQNLEQDQKCKIVDTWKLYNFSLDFTPVISWGHANIGKETVFFYDTPTLPVEIRAICLSFLCSHEKIGIAKTLKPYTPELKIDEFGTFVKIKHCKYLRKYQKYLNTIFRQKNDKLVVHQLDRYMLQSKFDSDVIFGNLKLIRKQYEIHQKHPHARSIMFSDTLPENCIENFLTRYPNPVYMWFLPSDKITFELDWIFKRFLTKQHYAKLVKNLNIFYKGKFDMKLGKMTMKFPDNSVASWKFPGIAKPVPRNLKQDVFGPPVIILPGRSVLCPIGRSVRRHYTTGRIIWLDRRWKFETISPFTTIYGIKSYLFDKYAILRDIKFETHFLDIAWIKHSHQKIHHLKSQSFGRFRTQKFTYPICQTEIYHNLYLRDGKCV